MSRYDRGRRTDIAKISTGERTEGPGHIEIHYSLLKMQYRYCWTRMYTEWPVLA